jgi:hypothetical protein
MRYVVVAAGLLAGCLCFADALGAQEACVRAPNGAIVCGPIIQPNFEQPNYGPPARQLYPPRHNFEQRRDYDDNQPREDRRGERPDARRREPPPDTRRREPPPDTRRGGPPPDVQRTEPPDQRRSEQPEPRQGQRPEDRRSVWPDDGRDRDRRGEPNPCARYGSNFMLRDGECRPYVRR